MNFAPPPQNAQHVLNFHAVKFLKVYFACPPTRVGHPRLRLGTHSQWRSNQHRAAPLCCCVASLGLFGGCCCSSNHSQSGWGDAKAAQC